MLAGKYIIRTTLISFLVIIFVLCVPLSVSAESEYDCSAGAHKYIEIEHVSATAVTDGFNTYRCEICGIQWSEVIFATDHLWSSWIVDKAPTCTEKGERHRVCTRGASHEHYEQIPSLEHDYRETLTEPGCEIEGYKTFTCSRCSDSFTEAVPARAHEYEEQITKEPSCLEDGVKTFICIYCGTGNAESIPAFGHSFGEWFVERGAEEGIPGVEARVCANDSNHRETRGIAALPLSEPKTEPMAEPEYEDKPLFNTADIVIASLNVGMTGLYSVLIVPYILFFIYMRKRRKKVEKQNDVRRAVAKLHDFK